MACPSNFTFNNKTMQRTGRTICKWLIFSRLQWNLLRLELSWMFLSLDLLRSEIIQYLFMLHVVL